MVNWLRCIKRAASYTWAMFLFNLTGRINSGAPTKHIKMKVLATVLDAFGNVYSQEKNNGMKNSVGVEPKEGKVITRKPGTKLGWSHIMEKSIPWYVNRGAFFCTDDNGVKYLDLTECVRNEYALTAEGELLVNRQKEPNYEKEVARATSNAKSWEKR